MSIFMPRLKLVGAGIWFFNINLDVLIISVFPLVGMKNSITKTQIFNTSTWEKVGQY